MIYLNLQNHINKDKDYRMLIFFNNQNRESNPVLRGIGKLSHGEDGEDKVSTKSATVDRGVTDP